MNTTESEHRPEHRPEHQSTRATSPRNLIIGAVVVALLIILGVYLWGNAQTRSQLEAQRTDYEQRISQMESQLQGTQGELASARNRNQLLMARTDLYRAAAALDLRNFGIANTHLRQAEQALGRIDASSANLDAGKLKQLRSSIDSLNINVATNLQDQRNQVLDLAAQLDTIALQGSEVGAARAP
ncbi:MAG: hypothetical protein M3Q42_12960 [Pseudomonadota bacterium]|nr:hypothetical protein [Pseudomonadota bacterium]